MSDSTMSPPESGAARGPVSQSIRLMSPEEIAVGAGAQPAPLRVPDAGVFAERAARLRQHADGHAMRDYLLFIAEIAQRQHEQLKQPRALKLPDETAVAGAMVGGLPPLDVSRHRRDPVWIEDLRALLQAMSMAPVPDPVRALLRDLVEADDAFFEQQAQALLAGGGPGLAPAPAPLIAAGLQLHWVRLAQQLQARFERSDPSRSLAPFGLIDDPTICPCCGSRPVASITRIAADNAGQRFLACSLCASQWHYVRIKCTHCQGTKGISFRGLVGDDGEAASASVQAECCETCGHYLKQVLMEKDLQSEPLADDLATLTLDLLVGELGLVRQGFNPMLILGEPEAGAPPPDPGGH